MTGTIESLRNFGFGASWNFWPERPTSARDATSLGIVDDGLVEKTGRRNLSPSMWFILMSCDVGDSSAGMLGHTALLSTVCLTDGRALMKLCSLGSSKVMWPGRIQ